MNWEEDHGELNWGGKAHNELPELLDEGVGVAVLAGAAGVGVAVGAERAAGAV